MSHSENIDELLSAYLDGELAGDALVQVENRLQADADFRRCYDDFKALRESLQQLPRYKLSSDFATGVVAQIQPDAPVLPTPDSAASELVSGSLDRTVGTSAESLAVTEGQRENSELSTAASHGDQTSDLPDKRRAWIMSGMGVLAASLLLALVLPIARGRIGLVSTTDTSPNAAHQLAKNDSFESPSAVRLHKTTESIENDERDQRADAVRMKSGLPSRANQDQDATVAEDSASEAFADVLDEVADESRMSQQLETRGVDKQDADLASERRDTNRSGIRSGYAEPQSPALPEAQLPGAQLPEAQLPEAQLPEAKTASSLRLPSVAPDSEMSLANEVESNASIADFRVVLRGVSRQQLTAILSANQAQALRADQIALKQDPESKDREDIFAGPTDTQIRQGKASGSLLAEARMDLVRRSRVSLGKKASVSRAEDSQATFVKDGGLPTAVSSTVEVVFHAPIVDVSDLLASLDPVVEKTGQPFVELEPLSRFAKDLKGAQDSGGREFSFRALARPQVTKKLEQAAELKSETKSEIDAETKAADTRETDIVRILFVLVEDSSVAPNAAESP